MPTVLSAVNDSGVITVTHVEGERDEDNRNDVVDVRKAQDIDSHHVEYYYMNNSKCQQGTQTELTSFCAFIVVIETSKKKWEGSS